MVGELRGREERGGENDIVQFCLRPAVTFEHTFDQTATVVADPLTVSEGE
ncbi:hypothetical protein [Halosimplex salinum]|nr:hypothetical protein [Halosimplex salinum]